MFGDFKKSEPSRSGPDYGEIKRKFNSLGHLCMFKCSIIAPKQLN